MTPPPPPPPGQGPIDPRGAFAPPGAPSHGVPPPMMYPPMPVPPPMYYPPPRGGAGFARAIFLTLATTIFGLSLVLNLYLLVFAGIAGSGGGSGINQQSILVGDPGQKVVVLPIKDVIDESVWKHFDRMMKQAENDASVKALVLEVDTPGGEMTASDEIYQRVLTFKKNKPNVPVVVAMGSMATSGGYYVSCAADEIYAQPTTLTGNIGVVLFRMNFYGMLEKIGVKETSITPDDSLFKNSESMFRPETPETVAYLRGLADEMHERFRSIVQQSRQSKLAAPMDVVANGKVFTASEALKMKLIDQIGYTSDACARAAALAGLGKPTIVRYQRPVGFVDAVLFGETSFRGRGERGGLSIHLDPSTLQEMARPRLMYLWQGP